MRTLRNQLLISTLLLLSLSLGIMGVWLTSEIRSFYMEETKQNLTRQAYLAELLVRERFNAANLDEVARAVGGFINLRTTLVLPDGQVIGETEKDAVQLENHGDRPEVKMALEGELGVDLRISRTAGVQMLYVAVPSYSDDGKIQGVVRLSLDMSEVQAVSQRIILFTLVGGLVALAAGGALSLLLAKSTSLPLERMVQVARGLASGSFGHRAHVVGPCETRELAQAINSMADNLQTQFRSVQFGAQKLQAILSSMRDGVILIDQSGTLELINPAAEDMLGFDSSVAAGKHHSVLFRHNELGKIVEQVMSTGQAAVSRIALSGRSSSKQIRAAVLLLDSGRVLITLQDLTEVFRAMDIRRDFVANVSHELRTPLTSLGLMVENLLNGALDEKEVAEDFLRRMSLELDRLTKMVLELLQLSRLESGAEEIRKEVFPAVPLLEEVANELEGILSQKTLHLNIDAEQSAELWGDRSKLKQVLINLLDNAIKFSSHGQAVTIGLREQHKDMDLFISDTGPGIAPEHLPRVYERFFKASASRGGGTGLGLSIVKHIAEVHGGSAYVRSRLGQGATFGILIPKSPR